MKIRTKINVFTPILLVGLAIAIVLVGVVVIEQILFSLNSKLMTLELRNVIGRLQRRQQTLARAQVGMIESYVAATQQKALVSLKNYKFGRTGHLFIIDPKGELLLSSADNAHKLTPKVIQSIIKKQKGTLTYDQSGPEEMCVYDTFPDWGWTLGLAIERGEVMEARDHYLKSVTLLTLAVLFVLMIIVHFFVRGTVVRLSTLSAYVHDVWHGNLAKSLKVVNPDDEIGVLENGLNEMVRHRQKTEEELRQHQDHLEDLVNTRTAELHGSNERLRKLFEHMASGGAIYEAINDGDDFIFKDFNQTAEKIEKVSRDDVIGKSLTECFPGALEMGYLDAVRRVYKTGRSEYMPATLYKNELGEGWRQGFIYKLPTGEVVSIYEDVTEQKESEKQMEILNKELRDASMRAGMAEVASGVLHNVGNVLNSVNVSASRIKEQINESEVSSLSQVVDLLKSHEENLGDFIENDPKGRKIIPFLEQLGVCLTEERSAISKETASLTQNVDHIKEVVRMQQDYASSTTVEDQVYSHELMRDALRLNADTLERHNIETLQEFGDPIMIRTVRHKALQILINLIRNAKQAILDARQDSGRIILRIQTGDDDNVILQVEDNGAGISSENMSEIWSYGFSTREKGSGFGLHHSVLSAKELGGSLTAESDGPGKGARFTLSLPRKI